jgi:hypothetical protein
VKVTLGKNTYELHSIGIISVMRYYTVWIAHFLWMLLKGMIKLVLAMSVLIVVVPLAHTYDLGSSTRKGNDLLDAILKRIDEW